MRGARVHLYSHTPLPRKREPPTRDARRPPHTPCPTACRPKVTRRSPSSPRSLRQSETAGRGLRHAALGLLLRQRSVAIPVRRPEVARSCLSASTSFGFSPRTSLPTWLVSGFSNEGIVDASEWPPCVAKAVGAVMHEAPSSVRSATKVIRNVTVTTHFNVEDAWWLVRRCHDHRHSGPAPHSWWALLHREQKPGDSATLVRLVDAPDSLAEIVARVEPLPISPPR